MKSGQGSGRRRIRGQSMAEYALIIALVAIAVIGAVTLLGDRIGLTFRSAASALQDAGSDGSTGSG